MGQYVKAFYASDSKEMEHGINKWLAEHPESTMIGEVSDRELHRVLIFFSGPEADSPYDPNKKFEYVSPDGP